LSVLFSYRIAKKLNLKYAHLIFIPFYAAPLFFKVQFSGLTEPFSALLLSAFILCWLENKKTTSIILISFIPFIRSEGLIILGVVFLYLLWTKNWKLMPFLALGHLVISILGVAFYNDILWVFTKIPYAKLSSIYGVGNWMHFVNQLYYCLGPITYLLLILGIVKITLELFLNKTEFFTERLFLVYGIFMAFFVAHTSFWALGIFSSMGLNRVFITVIPLIGILSIEALEWVSTKLSSKVENAFVITTCVITIVFAFLHNPASIDFKSDLKLDEGQKLVKDKIVPYLKYKYPEKIYMSGDVSISLFSNKNVFNPKEYLLLYDTNPLLIEDSNFVFIWDSWFAPVEGNLNLDELKASDRLEIDTVFYAKGNKSENLEYIIFKRK
jgi:hypothetical protein